MVGALQELVDSLRLLPSVGEKSAWRMALYLMEQPTEISLRLAQALEEAHQKLKRCNLCHSWTEYDRCDICTNSSRDQHCICVVERNSDVFALEKSGRYQGVYHVLGGALSPINGITADKLTIDSLIRRVQSENIQEVILGLGGSSEAETTTLYISRLLENTPVIVSRFARGLAAGMEVEYADHSTLTQALHERKIIQGA